MKPVYKKITYALMVCPVCQGAKHIYEKEYHNHLVDNLCYKCAGKGKIRIQRTDDATREVEILREKVRKLKNQKQ